MSKIRSLAIASLMALVTLPALAQQFRADGKISGDAFRGHQARTYQQHARDYSQMLYYSGRCEQPLEQQAAKQHVAGIRKNVDAAGKALDGIKEANAGKPAVAKAVDKIKERHKKVIAKCDELDAHVAKADKDTTVLCDCCLDATEELDGAVKETDALLKELKVNELPKPSKSAGKGAPSKK
jgi:hypothetical protein